MYTISKELLDKWNKIQIDTFNELNEKGKEHTELLKIMANKEKYDKSAISLRLKYLKECIMKLESKSDVLISFLIEIVNENKKLCDEICKRV